MIIYCNNRNIYLCKVISALKDNNVCKKGESYIWVKSHKFAPKEYFKNEEGLDKQYPKYLKINKKELKKIILKTPIHKIDSYLNDIFNLI